MKRILLLITGTIALVYMVSILLVFRGFSGNAEFPADCAVVFGAAVHGNNKAGPGIRRRVHTAVDLWKEHSVATIFVSGGKGRKSQHSEASVMHNYAVSNGVESRDIVMEHHAHSTWENLENVRPLTKHCTSTVGISDRYHLTRIAFIAWLQGWDNFSVHPAKWHSTKWFEVRSVLREAVGLPAMVLPWIF